MTIGEKIKQARKQANLTQRQLADALGMAEISIRQYEAGNRAPKLRTLGSIAKALNTTVYEMIGPDWTGIDTTDAWEDEGTEKPVIEDDDGWRDAVRALPPDLLGILSDFVQLAKESPETAKRYLAFAVQELRSQQ